MDDFYAARGRLIPPLPWPTFAPPFSLRAALPLGLAIQARLFGDEGRPGGRLLDLLVRIDHDGRIDVPSAEPTAVDK